MTQFETMSSSFELHLVIIWWEGLDYQENIPKLNPLYAKMVNTFQ
jgi:hypothetical protein